MIIFGKRAVRKAETLAKEAEKLNKADLRKIDDARLSAKRLKALLEANGISLRVYIATGGDKRHA